MCSSVFVEFSSSATGPKAECGRCGGEGSGLDIDAGARILMIKRGIVPKVTY